MSTFDEWQKSLDERAGGPPSAIPGSTEPLQPGPPRPVVQQTSADVPDDIREALTRQNELIADKFATFTRQLAACARAARVEVDLQFVGTRTEGETFLDWAQKQPEGYRRVIKILFGF